MYSSSIHPDQGAYAGLEVWPEDPFVMEESPLKRRIKGLLVFRLLMALFFLLLTVLVQNHRQDEILSGRLEPLYFFSCALFVFTLFAAAGLNRIRNLKRFAYSQLFFDVAAVTSLIFLSGGVDSLFTFLYMPVIISAAMLLYRRGSLLIAAWCTISYGALLDLQYFGWLVPLQVLDQGWYLRESGLYLHSLVMNIVVFFLVAYLSGCLAEELQRSTDQAQEHKKDFLQLAELHGSIVQSLNSGLLIISPTGYILFFNRAAEKILGLPAERVQGRALNDIFTGLDPTHWPREPLVPGWPSKVRDMQRLEITYERAAGEQLYLGYTVSVLEQTGRNDSGWVFIFQDLTKLKTLEEQMQRADRLAFAGKIAAEIAHDIKNPLAAMSGAVQMLQNGVHRDPTQQQLMGILDREIYRINDLVTDFLWLARGTSKPKELTEVSVCTVIEEILQLLKDSDKCAAAHEVRAAFEVRPVLRTDPHHIRRILWNLLVNALESMPAGGVVEARVARHASDTTGSAELRIDISDSGVGIAEAYRDRIFEPFFTTKKTGTGLGLSIVYQLVENLGGRLEVAHHVEAGTTFSLFFPDFCSFSLAK